MIPKMTQRGWSHERKSPKVRSEDRGGLLPILDQGSEGTLILSLNLFLLRCLLLRIRLARPPGVSLCEWEYL